MRTDFRRLADCIPLGVFSIRIGWQKSRRLQRRDSRRPEQFSGFRARHYRSWL